MIKKPYSLAVAQAGLTMAGLVGSMVLGREWGWPCLCLAGLSTIGAMLGAARSWRAAGARHLALLGIAVLLPMAAQAQGDSQPVATALLPQDLSFAGMIENADWVVKAVLAGLAFASVLTWTVALAKTAELLTAGRRARAGLAVLLQARSVEDAAAQMAGASGPCAELLTAAREEAAASAGVGSKEGIKERAAWRLDRLVAGAGRAMSRGTGVLATIGATAPFVGLFGTVWGIMNSFIGISRSQTTNLAVVAPGIAEALLATAIGLVAAIPAVVIYNLFARAITGHRARLADASAATMALLSRDLDRAGTARLRAVGE